MSLTFALIITSCTYDSVYCVQQKTYYPTELECGVAATAVASRIEREKPKAKVIYFCLEQDIPVYPSTERVESPAEVDSAMGAVAPPFASVSTAARAWEFLRSQ